MIEIIVGVVLGLAISRILHVPPKLPNPDRILKWDPKIMGYRPVINIKDVQDSDEILFAFVFKRNPEAKE